MEVLMCTLANEKYCIPLVLVEAVEHMTKITAVPKSKKHIIGVVNIRGKIIPVLDMLKLLGFDKDIMMNKLILIHSNNNLIAILADDVDDVVTINQDDVERITLNDANLSIVKYQNNIATLITQEQIDKI